jgi:hypothetical protein
MDERKKLLKLLQKFESLLNGTLGDWGEDEALDLELQSGAKPHHDHPYRIPQIHRETFKKSQLHGCTSLVFCKEAMKKASGELLASLSQRRMELCSSLLILGS